MDRLLSLFLFAACNLCILVTFSRRNLIKCIVNNQVLPKSKHSVVLLERPVLKAVRTNRCVYLYIYIYVCVCVYVYRCLLCTYVRTYV
jgi:hypothetical protein